ncbi:MAG TPA: hypothetical protein VH092_05885, partial [Urbifossiella sp.]|nr:hypothetical protein [Urbifossiella sp.]
MGDHSCRALFLAAVGILCPTPATAADPPPPRLIVLVYFDQFRGDYLDRWKSELGEGGFKRLTTDGA